MVYGVLSPVRTHTHTDTAAALGKVLRRAKYISIYSIEFRFDLRRRKSRRIYVQSLADEQAHPKLTWIAKLKINAAIDRPKKKKYRNAIDSMDCGEYFVGKILLLTSCLRVYSLGEHLQFFILIEIKEPRPIITYLNFELRKGIQCEYRAECKWNDKPRPEPSFKSYSIWSSTKIAMQTPHISPTLLSTFIHIFGSFYCCVECGHNVSF